MNGEIKLYNFNQLTIDYSINGHLRGINSLIIVNECIVSGGEDGCLNIWKINGKEEKIDLKKNLRFEDKMIVGVNYDERKNCLYVNFFDFSEVSNISNINFN
jgi:WD40 repeat protein